MCSSASSMYKATSRLQSCSDHHASTKRYVKPCGNVGVRRSEVQYLVLGSPVESDENAIEAELAGACLLIPASEVLSSCATVSVAGTARLDVAAVGTSLATGSGDVAFGAELEKHPPITSLAQQLHPSSA